MSKIKKVIVGTSVLAGLSVLSIPALSYADTQCVTGTTCSESATLDTTINVAEMISVQFISYSGASSVTKNCNSQDQTESSDGCTGADQIASSTLLPGTSNVANNSSSAYTELRVSTNAPGGYILTLIDADENTSLVNTAGDVISAINSQPVGTSNPGWAVSINGTGWQIMKHNKSSDNTITAETPITVKTNNPSTSGTTSTTISNDLSTVYYGIATSSAQPIGIYTDIVEYTATTQ